MAINEAMSLVEKSGNLPVPLHLRNAPTKLMKELDYGKNYLYAHDYPNNFVEQQFLPDSLQNTRLWIAQVNPAESKISDYLKMLREAGDDKRNYKS